MLDFEGSTEGVDGFVEIQASSALDLNSLTITMWIRPAAAMDSTGCPPPDSERLADDPRAFDESCQRAALMAHGEDPRGLAQYVLFLNEGRLLLWVEDENDADHLAESTGPAVYSGTWTHVAATIDHNKQKAHFYVNGEHAGSSDFAASSPSVNYRLLLGARTATLGTASTTYRDFYRGRMDDVMTPLPPCASLPPKRIVTTFCDLSGPASRGLQVEPAGPQRFRCGSSPP